MFPVETVWVDVNPFLLRQEQPVIVLERPKAHDMAKAWAGNSEIARMGEFFVPTSSLLAEHVVWSRTKTGEFVRVPVHAYKTTTPDISALFGLAIELGVRAAALLPDRAQGATLVLGHEIHTLPDGTYRGYAGFSFRAK